MPAPPYVDACAELYARAWVTQAARWLSPKNAGLLLHANLLYMRAFAEAWPDPEIVQRVVGRLPWGQNIELLTKLSEPTPGVGHLLRQRNRDRH